jgi:hypothetical protein
MVDLNQESYGMQNATFGEGPPRSLDTTSIQHDERFARSAASMKMQPAARKFPKNNHNLRTQNFSSNSDWC